MKTKIFFLLAALLLSVCAFAQSGSGTLKGDVNNDGTVDVADINAIIEIMKNGGGTGEETKYYFSIGTNAVTASNYTTVNNATTTIPTTTQTFVNNSGSKAAIYVLVPSSKNITMVDMSIGLPIPFTENTSISIANHKVYVTTGRIANGGGVIITLSDGTGEETKYYWYVGTTVPTDPTNTTQNTGNNKWTSIGTELPTSDIKVNKVDTTYNFHTWYIAAPSAANFTLYNATNVASDEAGWNKTTFNVGSVQYTLWTCKATSYQAVGYLHK